MLVSGYHFKTNQTEKNKKFRGKMTRRASVITQSLSIHRISRQATSCLLPFSQLPSGTLLPLNLAFCSAKQKNMSKRKMEIKLLFIFQPPEGRKQTAFVLPGFLLRCEPSCNTPQVPSWSNNHGLQAFGSDDMGITKPDVVFLASVQRATSLIWFEEGPAGNVVNTAFMFAATFLAIRATCKEKTHHKNFHKRMCIQTKFSMVALMFHLTGRAKTKCVCCLLDL